VLEHSRLQESKASSLPEHLRGGCGVRSTSRRLGVAPNTVVRYACIAGKHAVAVHDELVAVSPETRRARVSGGRGAGLQTEGEGSGPFLSKKMKLLTVRGVNAIFPTFFTPQKYICQYQLNGVHCIRRLKTDPLLPLTRKSRREPSQYEKQKS
jgi:hypothetical protein